MGKLNTKLGLPPKILLQGWANIMYGTNINGEYIYNGSFYENLNNSDYQIVYVGENVWWFNDTQNDPNQWNAIGPSNELPLTGWIVNNAEGEAGTIIPILINTKNISIKKQNLGSGKLSLN